MGYYAAKQKYLGTISKTVTITYPKSESGGSRSVTVEEPIYVDVYVESDPFERSVDKCDTSLHLLQAGIVAAEQAEKKSKQENSLRLGQSLDDGFFQVVNSNITMQAKEEAANAKALVGALFAQQKELLTIRKRMEDDYNLIKSRYIKTFEAYDQELRNRIYALDKRTFRLVQESDEELMRPANSMLMTASILGQKESLLLQTKITASRIKYFTAQVIRRVKDFIEGQNRLKFRLADILTNGHNRQTYSVPAAYLYTAEGNHTEGKVYCSQAINNPAGINDEIAQVLKDPRLSWTEMKAEEKTRITEELAALTDAHYATYGPEKDRRIAQTLLKLWNNHTPLTLNH